MSKDKARDLDAEQLQALAAIPGALKIITNEVQPDLRTDRKDVRAAANDGVDLRDPASFVQHDVVRVEGPDHRGLYTAWSAEGDWTAGSAGAVLRRLQEWRQG